MTEKNILSHGQIPSFEAGFEEISTRLKAQSTSPKDLQMKLKILEELASFSLGRFLIQNRGLNGFWTHWVCTYSKWKGSQTLKPLEEEILEKMPAFVATQKRFGIFQ